MNSSEVIVSENVFEGEWLPCSLTWDAVPTEVKYQTFIDATGVAIGVVATLPTPAAEMTFVIPASRLPAGTTINQRVKIVVTATFAGGSARPLVGIANVQKLPAFV